jgi:hypothetical protein
MSITQFSQIQVRRGLEEDLPQLAAGEIGWSTDAQRLWIGNGVLGAPDYAPSIGQTEILTQYSILNFTNTLTGNVAALQANLAIVQGNLVSIGTIIQSLGSSTITAESTLNVSTNTQVVGISANNATISYTLVENGVQRTGSLKYARFAGSSTVSYDEEYSQTSTTLTSLGITANTGYVTFWGNTSTNPATLTYRIVSI